MPESANGVNCHPKANVMLIFTDDQGYGDLGCYGNEELRTPHLDQMAEEGMRLPIFTMLLLYLLHPLQHC